LGKGTWISLTTIRPGFLHMLDPAATVVPYFLVEEIRPG
jgi:hypothetical protein